MRIIVIVLSTIIVIQFVILVVLGINHANELESKKAQEGSVLTLQQTVEALQRDDVLRLIEHVRKVMAGEIVYECETNPLSQYSYDKDLYPTMDRIEMDLKVLEVSLDGNSGIIKSTYTIRYLDSSGKTVRGSGVDSHFPAIWTLEKQGENWSIIDIVEGKHALNRP